jgi:hypothetical protein
VGQVVVAEVLQARVEVQVQVEALLLVALEVSVQRVQVALLERDLSALTDPRPALLEAQSRTVAAVAAVCSQALRPQSDQEQEVMEEAE